MVTLPSGQFCGATSGRNSDIPTWRLPFQDRSQNSTGGQQFRFTSIRMSAAVVTDGGLFASCLNAILSLAHIRVGRSQDTRRRALELGLLNLLRWRGVLTGEASGSCSSPGPQHDP